MPFSTDKKEIPYDQLVVKMASFCAYQERCIADADQKLEAFVITQEDKIRLIEYLLDENFLNELRFAKSVARGKFNFKSWGRRKITAYLKGKMLTDSLIQKALLEISEQDYFLKCLELIQKKRTDYLTKDLSPLELKLKVIKALQLKGFEFDVIEKAYQEVE